MKRPYNLINKQKTQTNIQLNLTLNFKWEILSCAYLVHNSLGWSPSLPACIFKRNVLHLSTVNSVLQVSRYLDLSPPFLSRAGVEVPPRATNR